MSFHTQKKTLGLERNQILNQGRFLRGGRDGEGAGVQSDLENCAYLWKNPGYVPDYCDNSAKR